MKTKDIENIYDHWYKKSAGNSFEEIQQGFYKLAAKYKAKNIAKSFRSKNNFEILDIGGGTGEVSEILYVEHHFPPSTLVDISQDGVNISQEKSGVKSSLKFDGYNIPLEDRSIDFGFSTHVLEHVPNPRQFLREIHRVCKKAFIEVPIDFSDNIPTKDLLSFGHINIFTPSTARFLIESEGFKILNEFPSYMQCRYDMNFYNYFYNNKNSINIITKTKFLLKHFASKLKRNLTRKYPTEYCFLIAPDDNFKITSLVETQRCLREKK